MMWLKRYLEDYLSFEVMVSDKSKQADYASNVLMKHKLNQEDLLAHVFKHPLIQDVKVVSGYLNMTLTDQLIVKQGQPKQDLSRMKTIYDRLEIEGYTSGAVPSDWLPLVKKINEMNHSLQTYNMSFDLEKDIINLFEGLDNGYIYRSLPDESLGGIYTVLKQMLLVLERK